MSVEVVDEDEQSLSHFISNTPWEDEPLIEAIGKRTVELLSQGGVFGALILDERGIPKQGTESVGGSPSVLWSAGEDGQLSS